MPHKSRSKLYAQCVIDTEGLLWCYTWHHEGCLSRDRVSLDTTPPRIHFPVGSKHHVWDQDTNQSRTIEVARSFVARLHSKRCPITVNLRSYDYGYPFELKEGWAEL